MMTSIPPEHQAAVTEALAGIYTLDELMARTFPEPKWAVDGLITEGACILGGRPKAGKSWFSNQLGIAVATGRHFLAHYPTRAGSVLYLALEDTARRLKKRSSMLLAGMGIADHKPLCIVNTWPRADKGGTAAVNAWLDTHPDARLVIVDTLAKARRLVKNGDSSYQADYQAMDDFQKIGLERGISVVLNTHTRKPAKGQEMDDEDPLDEINGTTGLTGSADTVLVLTRKRRGGLGKLFVTGRDIEEEHDLHLQFSRDTGLWTIRTDNSHDDGLTPERRNLLTLVKSHDGAITIGETATGLGVPAATARQLLKRATDDGHLARDKRGKYALPLSQGHNVTNSTETHTMDIMTAK